jgi:hypothetical protein
MRDRLAQIKHRLSKSGDRYLTATSKEVLADLQFVIREFDRLSEVSRNAVDLLRDMQRFFSENCLK